MDKFHPLPVQTVAISTAHPAITLMNKLQAYFRDSYQELTEKVTWPTWAQLQQSTMIVIVATLLITAMVWLMDLASSNILKFVYSLFK
jgi:preprotein translocase subunit SecE